MRKQFNLQEWLKDKSQKVETRDGRIVHNIWPIKEPIIANGKKAEVCALIDGEEDALVFFEGGKYLSVNSENPFDLFIVTPEKDLALTLEDIVRLDCLIMNMVGEGYNNGYKTRPFYEEVLKRFNEIKKK